MQVWQVAGVSLIDWIPFDYFIDKWWVVLTTVSLCQKLSLSFLHQDFLNWLIWMNTTELLIVLEDIWGNLGCNPIFNILLFSFRSNCWSVPFSFRCSILRLFLCNFTSKWSLRSLWPFGCARLVWIYTSWFSFLESLGFSSIVPFFSNLFFPVLILSDFFDSILNDGKGLSNFKIFKVFFIIEIISKFDQIINFCLLLLFLLLFSCSPSWLLWSFWLFRRFNRFFSNLWFKLIQIIIS